MTLVVGVLGVECDVGEGRMCTWSGKDSGLLVAWAVIFWGSSPASFQLPSSLITGRISSFLLHGPKTTHNCGTTCSSLGASAGSSFNSS